MVFSLYQAWRWELTPSLTVLHLMQVGRRLRCWDAVLTSVIRQSIDSCIRILFPAGLSYPNSLPEIRPVKEYSLHGTGLLPDCPGGYWSLKVRGNRGLLLPRRTRLNMEKTCLPFPVRSHLI